MARYVVNSKAYIFALTASIDGDLRFEPLGNDGEENIGIA